MNSTEENIVYQLLNSIRAAELSNDEVIGERTVRSLMRVHRNELISKYSLGGLTIQDMCFQKFTPVLSSLSATELTATLPVIVQLPDNLGVKITTPNFNNIPLVSEENYYLGTHNPINKNQPKAKLEGQLLTVHLPLVSNQAMLNGSRLQATLDALQETKVVNISAVLDDPNDGTGYDWTKSVYPFPQELISELKKNLLRRDFNIILSTKSDQIPNMKNDTLTYHEQGKVQR